MADETPSKPSPQATQWIWLWAALAATACTVVMAVHCLRLGGEITALVGFGETLPLALHEDPRVPAGVVVQRGVDGYDGQFYYVAALTPFDEASPVPPPRRMRLLYPLMAWLIALGHATLTELAMVLVNLGAVAVSVLAAGIWLRDRGHPPHLAILAGLSGGAVMACQYLTPDALLVATLAVTFLMIDRDRWWWAWLALALAILTKEAALVAWVGILLHLLISLRPLRFLLMLTAPIPFALWVLLLRAMTGEWVVFWAMEHTLDEPGAAWLSAMTAPLDGEAALRDVAGPALAALIPPFMVLVASQGLGRRDRPLALTALLWAAAAAMWTSAIWEPFAASTRNLAPLALLGVLLAAKPRRWGRWALIALIAINLLLTLLRALGLGEVPEVYHTIVDDPPVTLG